MCLAKPGIRAICTPIRRTRTARIRRKKRLHYTNQKTDHWFHGEGRQEENFLLLNGTEFDVGSTVQEGIYHIVGIGMEKAPALTKRAPGLSAQKIIDEIHNVNGIAILAHPAWSLDRASEAVRH